MSRKIYFALLIVLLSACAAPTPEVELLMPIPAEELPTVVALTVQAQGTTGALQEPHATEIILSTNTALPTILADTPTPSPTLSPITATPATDTPAPQIPLADIELNGPGALSKVAAPIAVRALLRPGADGLVTVDLLGEDGRLLSRKIVTMNTELTRKLGLAINIRYQLPGVSELGRLVIYTLDEHGRTTQLNSVDIILLSDGYADTNVVIDTLATVWIESPLPNTLVHDGTLIASGMLRPTNELDLVAELITADGSVVGSRVFSPEASAENVHRQFVVEVPYTVSETTTALFVIRARGDRIPGTTYLTSVEVILNP